MAVREGESGLRLLGKKLGRNWLPVLIVSMLAVVAVTELHTPYMPAALWLCAIIAILAVRENRRRPKRIKRQPRMWMSRMCRVKTSFPA